MLEKPAKKTGSAPKPRSRNEWLQLGFLVFLVVACLATLGFMIISRGGPGCIQIVDVTDLDEVASSPKRISGPHYECLVLERVSTPEAIVQGLSGRESMPHNHGMLFIFSEPGKHCFWMKDMNFPLDMIWINADKEVIDIREDIQPDSYPQSFCPDQPALYVLEVNAGVADKAYLTPGSKLQF